MHESPKPFYFFLTLPFRGKLKKDIWNDPPSEWEHFLELLNYGGLRRQVYSESLIKGFEGY